MNKFIYLFILFFSLVNTHSFCNENIMILKLKYGEVEIQLYPEKAPNHVKRFKDLANEGKYDNVVFHRVIDGFMAQTGDVKFGNTNIETMFLMSDVENQIISSNFVKEITKLGGNINKFVTKSTVKMLKNKF